jgi:sugar O-acyltransferase (sialic acid O-acetyltransferase NeuD family)
MKSVLIIDVTDSKWSEIVSNCKEYDFYHTQSYHLLETDSSPVLIVVYFNQDYIALPIIIREIDGQNVYDTTSVYGYCGPISTICFDKLEKSHISYFQSSIFNFFKERNIISAFLRLHPLLFNQNIFKNFGEIVELSNTIAIDLSLTENEQKKQYRKSILYDINRLKKNGFEVFEATSKQDIDAFISIYKKNMLKVNANEEYFFSKDYFYQFIDSVCFDKKLLLVKKDGEVCAGALFTIINGIIQYHLAGTSQKYINFSPMKLLIDEIRSIGNSLNAKYVHLGGGLSSDEDDTLFIFKSGFSKVKLKYQIWKLIVDEKKYNELVTLNDSDINSDFFPLYRHKCNLGKNYIYGSSGHAKVIVDIFLANKESNIIILDDNSKINDMLLDFPIINFEQVDYLESNSKMIIAIGDNYTRQYISKRWKGKYNTMIHPGAIVSNYSKIGEGTVIMPGAIVNSSSSIGNHVIINSGAIVEHDCILSDFVHVCPNVALAGNVKVGVGSQIGIGACVIQGVKIGKWVTVGAGSVIIKDVPDYAVIVGNPGKIIKYNNFE